MALPVFLCTVTLFSLHAVIEASSHAADPVKILVFGDSQGDVGPTYQVVEDQLKKHGRAGTVVNAAIGGTLSCGWAKDPKAVAKAAIKAFGISGPELVWLTVGANDLAADSKYHECLDKIRTKEESHRCLQEATDRFMPCTTALLEGLWDSFPDARVGMYNYEVACLDSDCIEAAEGFLGGSFCVHSADPVACLVEQLTFWQTIYVDELQRRYRAPRFTGMNVLGACQQASGVPGASPGHPALTRGSRCDWMVACVHPKYGTPTATAIGDAMWNLWLENATTSNNTNYVPAVKDH